MKQFDILKKSLLVSCLCAAGTVNAQVRHPLAFGSQTIGTTATPTNWYSDYVGLRLEVVSPAPVAGDKVYKTANDGNPANTSNWGSYPSTPIINKKVKMPLAPDSLGNNVTPHLMDGRVALIYRGNIEFGTKALHAQQMGAIAVILVNNIGGGPVGMAAGSDGASVTIPVFMISKADGDALDQKYNDAVASDTPVVSITTWGQGFNNDLGFVPGGTALSHDYAIPASQMTNNNPFAYGMIDGAFIANYGANTATNTKLSTTVTFTPNGGSASTVHTDVTATLPSFPVADSIYSFFAPSEYNLPQTTQQGRYDMTYTIQTDITDDYPADNTITNSFYTTANIYSKGRYDFAANEPVRTVYNSFNAGAEFTWGPMYYVANGHVSLQKVQYSLAFNVAVGGDPTLTDLGTCLLFKWVDGWHDTVLNVTYPADSIMQDGELILISLGRRDNIVAGVDTSNALLEMTTMRDTTGAGLTANLDSASWYYMAIDVPGGSFLGADGILDPYPRTYGRFMNSSNGYLDYQNLVFALDRTQSIYVNGAQGEAPLPGGSTAFINSVDSFNFDNYKGLLPQVAMITGPYQSAVKTIKPSFGNISLFPNPAVNSVTVSVKLQQPAKKVTYEIIDGLGRFVSKEVVYNIQNEEHVINTSKLASGNYYMIFSADDNIMSKKFTIAK